MATYEIYTEGLELENLSMEYYMGEDSYILQSDEGQKFISDTLSLEYQDLSEEEIVAAATAFRDTDDFHFNIADDFNLSMVEAHVLQRDKIPKEKLELVLEFCSNISIVHVVDINTNVIGLTGGGTNMSDSIELAYLIVDGYSPFSCDQAGLTLTPRGVNALMFLREVNMSGIDLTPKQLNERIAIWQTKKN